MEVFDAPPRDGGSYQKRPDGKYERVGAASAPRAVGETHREARGRMAAPAPEPAAQTDRPFGRFDRQAATLAATSATTGEEEA